MTENVTNEEFDLLIRAVREAGATALSYYGNNPRSDTKADGTSVSEADHAANDVLEQQLVTDHQAYGWLSEESEDDLSRLRHTKVWMVDPIDGTRAFLKPAPEWTVSAALVVDGAPEIAAVFNPVKDELFHARRGGGTFLNDTPVTVREPVDLDGACLAASPGLLRSSRWTRPWPNVKAVWVNSIAYRLALVAAGMCDGTISMSGKNDWDIAAADLLVREAGGRMTDHEGREFTYNRESTRQLSVVAAGPALHSALIERTSQATI
ncbi:MAG: 3'(2'),5'-bisphosphate nucleotidase CysQ [Hyphomicrobiaceae bacterium]|nr:3'(2'),5'-bisphosphate nucleotidase CysQ [Hyphomicrobiaceae bacterium]